MAMPRLIAKISLPLMISLLVQSLYNLVDAIFVSHINEAALSATSLASPVQMLMVAVSVGTGVGVNSLLSRSLGANDKERASSVATNGLILAVLSCLVFAVFGLTMVPAFIGVFTEDEMILGYGITYLKICTIFSLGIFVATTAERLLQATGKTFLSMIAQVIGAVANCILDPIMIFGYFGCPAMGIKGAAIATVIGQWLAATVALILNFRLNHDIALKKQNFRLQKGIVLGIYKVGVPSMLTSAMGSVQLMCVNTLMGGFSSTAIAFYGVYNKLQNFVNMPVNGLAQGLIPIVGHAYGAKRGSRIREAFGLTVKIAVVVMAVATCILLFFPAMILTMFNAGDDMMAIGVHGLRVMGWNFVFTAVMSVIGYTFTAMGNGMVNMSTTLIRYLLPLPILFVVASTSGIDSMWYAFPISAIVSCAIAVYLFIRGKKKMIDPLCEEKEE